MEDDGSRSVDRVESSELNVLWGGTPSVSQQWGKPPDKTTTSVGRGTGVHRRSQVGEGGG